MNTPKQFRPLLVVILTTLLLGIFFRFYHLDYKVYWHDEVFTSLRATGQSSQEIRKRLVQQGRFQAGELQQYQQLNPAHGWDDTLSALQHHPEHPPLYYLGTRLWMEWFGSSVAVTRSFAAVISLLAFPCLYWLCWELFQNRLVAGIALALFAVSPFQVLYAQEARQYSQWTLAVLLSSAVLLWARRESSFKQWASFNRWATYSATVVFGLYTSLFFIATLFSHGLYVVWVDGIRHKVIRFYGIATVIALFSFIPWMLVMGQYHAEFQEQTAWVKTQQPMSFLVKLWGLHISSNFIDPGLPLEHLYTYLVPPVFLVLVIAAGWLICRQTSKQVWSFILLLIGVNVGMLVLPDLLQGGMRSAFSRYYVPTYIGIQLLMSYSIAHWLVHPKFLLQRLGQFMFIGLLSVGVVSCAISAQADAWWNKGVSYHHPAIARIVNRATCPVVWFGMTPDTLGNTIAFSYRLEPDVTLQWIQDAEIPEIPTNSCDIFLYFPSEQFSQNLSQTYAGQIELIKAEEGLMYLKKTNAP